MVNTTIFKRNWKMMHSFYKKRGFTFIVSVLGICLSQTAFSKNVTCSLEIFSNESYRASYNGPCKIFPNEKLSTPQEKVFIVERLNSSDYLIKKVVGLEVTDFPTHSYINGTFGPNGYNPSLTYTNNAKRFTDKNKVCRVDKVAGFKLCIW